MKWFRLVAGTNRGLYAAAERGLFRADLLARIDLWTFELPPLRERPEDIEPNLDYELARFARRTGHKVRFAGDARRHFLRWSTTEARWEGNFRDLSAAVSRMATLCDGGRIHTSDVTDEIRRLRRRDSAPRSALVDRALPDAELDRFDRVQLEEVLGVCITQPSLAAAGRKLFAVSRTRRKSTNDADRLRKYLQKFGLDRQDIERLRALTP